MTSDLPAQPDRRVPVLGDHNLLLALRAEPALHRALLERDDIKSDHHVQGALSTLAILHGQAHGQPLRSLVAVTLKRLNDSSTPADDVPAPGPASGDALTAETLYARLAAFPALEFEVKCTLAEGAADTGEFGLPRSGDARIAAGYFARRHVAGALTALGLLSGDRSGPALTDAVDGVIRLVRTQFKATDQAVKLAMVTWGMNATERNAVTEAGGQVIADWEKISDDQGRTVITGQRGGRRVTTAPLLTILNGRVPTALTPDGPVPLGNHRHRPNDWDDQLGWVNATRTQGDT